MNSTVRGVLAPITRFNRSDVRRTHWRKSTLRDVFARLIQVYKAWRSRLGSGRKKGLDVDAIVRGAVAYHANCGASGIRGSEDLYADLGLSPLALALVVLDVEDILEIRLDTEDLAAVQTVRDLLSSAKRAIDPRREALVLLPSVSLVRANPDLSARFAIPFRGGVRQ